MSTPAPFALPWGNHEPENPTPALPKVRPQLCDLELATGDKVEVQAAAIDARHFGQARCYLSGPGRSLYLPAFLSVWTPQSMCLTASSSVAPAPSSDPHAGIFPRPPHPRSSGLLCQLMEQSPMIGCDVEITASTTALRASTLPSQSRSPMLMTPAACLGAVVGGDGGGASYGQLTHTRGGIC